ncbi:MAG TPA: hypothetical protein VKT72_06890 [Candidatus Baltobacteraceae bacterium]|nr:hypothetical protein [Candidatus Baltobacteraceae bacterium]
MARSRSRVLPAFSFEGAIAAVFDGKAAPGFEPPNSRRDVDVPTMVLLFDQFFWALLARITQGTADAGAMARASADLIYHAFVKG